MKWFPIVLVALAGCSSGTPTATTAGALVRGAPVAASVSSSPQGLVATAIVAERSSAKAESASNEADGGIDCQNGLDPSGHECDGGPAANPNDNSADATETTTPAGQVVVPKTLLTAGATGFNALGMTIVAPSTTPDARAVRFIGSRDASGRFVATTVRASTASTGRLVGKVESVTNVKGSSGVTLRILGQSVQAPSNLPLTLVDSVQAAADRDTDGVNCEQDGGYLGNNTGCTPAP